MKRIFLIILVGLIFSTAIFSENRDFRNANWGMTIPQVRVSEGSRKAQLVKDNSIAYIDTISGKTFFVYYFFTDNELVSGV